LILSSQLLAFHIVALAADVNTECSVAKMDELRNAAQAKDPKALLLADKLAECPSLRDEALVWAAIYETSMERYGQLNKYLEQLQQPSATANRMTILNQATRGAYITLQDLVNSGAPGWSNDAEANFVLARTLVRAHEMAEAKKAYEHYLELKPDDIDLQVEAAFALMVDYPRTTKQFLEGLEKRSDLSESQKEAVRRGRELLAQAYTPRYYSSLTTAGREVPLVYDQFSDSVKGFGRKSFRTGYYTPDFEFDLAKVILTSDDPSSAQTATEISVKKVFASKNKLTHLLAALGWFQGEEKGANRSQIKLSHSFFNGIIATVGYQTDPWVTHGALSKEYTSWTINTGSIGINYFDFLSYHFGYSTVASQVVINQNSLEFKYPVWRLRKGQQTWSIYALADALNADRFSQYVYSPKVAKTSLLGVLHEGHFGSGTLLRARASFGLVTSQLNDGDGGAGARSPTL
jgi:hypothetical protein